MTLSRETAERLLLRAQIDIGSATVVLRRRSRWDDTARSRPKQPPGDGLLLAREKHAPRPCVWREKRSVNPAFLVSVEGEANPAGSPSVISIGYLAYSAAWVARPARSEQHETRTPPGNALGDPRGSGSPLPRAGAAAPRAAPRAPPPSTPRVTARAPPRRSLRNSGRTRRHWDGARSERRSVGDSGGWRYLPRGRRACRARGRRAFTWPRRRPRTGASWMSGKDRTRHLTDGLPRLLWRLEQTGTA